MFISLFIDMQSMTDFLQPLPETTNKGKWCLTFGYGKFGKNVLKFYSFLKKLAQNYQGKMILIDVRKYPGCRWETAYNEFSLRTKVLEETDGRIFYISNKKLGNPNYKGAFIPKGLLQSACAKDGAFNKLTSEYDVIILMCAEKNHNLCHRTVIAEYIRTFHQFRVKHL